MTTAQPRAGQPGTAATQGINGPVVLIVSPHAGQAAHGPSPRDLLEAQGITVAEQVDVRALDLHQPQGERWRKQGYAAAIAAGGDGTIGGVATQLAGSGLTLGILPLGTSNDVARSLGVPLDLAAAATAIRAGVPTNVDAGEVVLLEKTETKAPDNEPDGIGQRLTDLLHPKRARQRRQQQQRQTTVNFVHAATLGLNAEFARLATDVARRQRWGSLTYATAALEAVLHIQPVSIKIHFSGVQSISTQTAQTAQNGQSEQDGLVASEITIPQAPLTHLVEAHVVQLAAVNTPIFGGRMNLHLPLSHPSDQLLDFVLIEAIEPGRLRQTMEGLLRALERMGDSLLHRAEEHMEADEIAASLALPGVQHIQAQSARIETPEPVEMTLDGELGLRTPVEIRVAAEPLRVLLPQSAHESLLHGVIPAKTMFRI